MSRRSDTDIAFARWINPHMPCPGKDAQLVWRQSRQYPFVWYFRERQPRRGCDTWNMLITFHQDLPYPKPE